MGLHIQKSVKYVSLIQMQKTWSYQYFLYYYFNFINEKQAAVLFADENMLTDICNDDERLFEIWKCCTTYDNKNIVEAH